MVESREELRSQFKEQEAATVAKSGGVSESSDKKRAPDHQDDEEVKRLRVEIAALKAEKSDDASADTIKKLKSEISALRNDKKKKTSESEGLVEAIHKMASAMSDKSSVTTPTSDSSCVKTMMQQIGMGAWDHSLWPTSQQVSFFDKKIFKFADVKDRLWWPLLASTSSMDEYVNAGDLLSDKHSSFDLGEASAMKEMARECVRIEKRRKELDTKVTGVQLMAILYKIFLMYGGFWRPRWLWGIF